MPTFVIDGKEQTIDNLGSCPACGASWDAGHFSRLVGIEIQGLYDGVIMWECPDCKTRWDRFKNRPSHRAGKAATI